MVVTDSIEVQTRQGMDVKEITEAVAGAVRDSGVRNGTVTVFVPGATGALSTVEYEPGLVKDLREFFDRVIPRDLQYHHEQRWHDENGHSHVRATLLGPSLVVPFTDGKLLLGTWQQIIFIDFDVPARQRRMVVQVMGEA